MNLIRFLALALIIFLCNSTAMHPSDEKKNYNEQEENPAIAQAAFKNKAQEMLKDFPQGEEINKKFSNQDENKAQRLLDANDAEMLLKYPRGTSQREPRTLSDIQSTAERSNATRTMALQNYQKLQRDNNAKTQQSSKKLNPTDIYKTYKNNISQLKNFFIKNNSYDKYIDMMAILYLLFSEKDKIKMLYNTIKNTSSATRLFKSTEKNIKILLKHPSLSVFKDSPADLIAPQYIIQSYVDENLPKEAVLNLDVVRNKIFTKIQEIKKECGINEWLFPQGTTEQTVINEFLQSPMSDMYSDSVTAINKKSFSQSYYVYTNITEKPIDNLYQGNIAREAQLNQLIKTTKIIAFQDQVNPLIAAATIIAFEKDIPDKDKEMVCFSKKVLEKTLYQYDIMPTYWKKRIIIASFIAILGSIAMKKYAPQKSKKIIQMVQNKLLEAATSLNNHIPKIVKDRLLKLNCKKT